MSRYDTSLNNHVISQQVIFRRVLPTSLVVFRWLRLTLVKALVSEQGENIRDYARYLQVRVQTWRELKYDYASQRPNGDQSGKLKKLEVEKGLLREVEGISRLVGVLLKCKVAAPPPHIKQFGLPCISCSD